MKSKIKVNGIAIFQWCAFIILACVSLFFIYNMSISIAIESIEKFAIVAGAIGLEFFKLFSIIKANTYAYIKKELGVVIKKRWWLYFTYIWVSLYSVAASFGYSLVAVDRMQTSTTSIDHQELISNENTNIENYDLTIQSYKNTNISYENSKVRYINQQKDPTVDKDAIQKRIDVLQKSIDSNQAKINDQMDKRAASLAKIADWKSSDLSTDKTSKRTMYDVIHDTVKIPAKTVAFIILLVFSTSIEVGIFTTAPHSSKVDNLSVPKNNNIPQNKIRNHSYKKNEENNIVESYNNEVQTENSVNHKTIDLEKIVQSKVGEVKKNYQPEMTVVKPKSITSADTRQSEKKVENFSSKEDRITIIPRVEGRAEEILQTLDDDKPRISSKVRHLLLSL